MNRNDLRKSVVVLAAGMSQKCGGGDTGDGHVKTVKGERAARGADL
jgi:hypothetical protein